MADSKNRIEEILKGLGLENTTIMVKAPGGQRNQVWICDDYIVRLNFQPDGQNLHNEARLLHEVPDFIPHPRVIAVGRDHNGEWQVQHRIEGQRLTQAWGAMPIDLRKQAVQQLAKLVRDLHSLQPANHEIQILPHTYLQVELPHRIVELAAHSKFFPYVDAALMDQVAAVTKEMANAISSPGRWGIVHNDLHFDNVLWDGRKITALIDYERACYGPLDLELDLFLRYCVYPVLYVQEEYEYLVHPKDYRRVPNWFFEAYPEILMVNHLTERLSLYSLIYDLQLLQKYPPKEKVNPRQDDHILNRIRAVIEGRSYLTTFIN